MINEAGAASAAPALPYGRKDGTVAQALRRREPGRALPARQWLLERADATAEEAVTRLVSMQAQAPYAPYFGLWSRLRKFGTADLAAPPTWRTR
ncbi:hypothetical protein [Nonomuraea sp. B19D2]|uniref:hypothetical protein n=1 Tax=Nonomuraea sp. B19D2 TaxID=3159561 RepID=UPI0032D9D257